MVLSYIGCALFGIIFFFLSAKETGVLGTRMTETLDWVHSWAPFSYIILAIVFVAPIVSIAIIQTWPVHEEPEDPMARYRRGDDVVED